MIFYHKLLNEIKEITGDKNKHPFGFIYHINKTAFISKRSELIKYKHIENEYLNVIFLKKEILKKEDVILYF